MTEFQSSLDALMKEWAECHKSKGWISFISDGAVNAEEYLKAKPKICFFLKEAYSKRDDEDWSLTEWLSDGAMTRMWGTVADWAYGLQRTSPTSIPPKPELTNSEKSDILQSIAIVNVKKSNGSVQSDYADLLQYAKSDQTYISRELSILDPDIIVCGNNSSLLRLMYGASIQKNGKVVADGAIDYAFMHKHGYVVMGGKVIIDFYHPANQYPAMMNYYTVCSLYQQALIWKG